MKEERISNSSGRRWSSFQYWSF